MFFIFRQTLDDQKKQISESKKKYEIVAENAKELEISKETEQKQFKQLLLDKEEEIELLSSKQDSHSQGVGSFEESFQELNQLLNQEKLRNAELQATHDQSMKIVKESARVTLEDNQQLREKIDQLEKELDTSKATEISIIFDQVAVVIFKQGLVIFVTSESFFFINSVKLSTNLN